MDADGIPFAALSFGTRFVYTVLSAGWSPGASSSTWSFGAGIGGRAGSGRMFLDADLSMVSQQSTAGWDQTTGSLFPRFRAVAGYQLTDWLALDAGVSVRILVPGLSASLAGYDPSRTVFQPVFIAGVHLG